jgi:hypothetical protein
LFIFSEPAAGWSVAFAAAVRDFNKLMHGDGVRLRYEITTDAKIANVIFSTAGANKVAHPLHGEFEQIGLIDGFTAPKVRITVRASPTILVWKTDPAKKDRQQVARAPGNGILSVVVAHELIHASGLDNDEHCDDDMFASELAPEGGRRPADDRLRVGKTGRLLPPLWIADDTAARLRDIWS